MDVGAGRCMYDVVVKKFKFAISSPDEFLVCFCFCVLCSHLQMFTPFTFFCMFVICICLLHLNCLYQVVIQLLLVCDMLVTFGSFVCLTGFNIKSINNQAQIEYKYILADISSRCELSRHVEIARTCSNLVADRFEAGRGPVADLLARASSLLASR